MKSHLYDRVLPFYLFVSFKKKALFYEGNIFDEKKHILVYCSIGMVCQDLIFLLQKGHCFL